MSQGTRTGAFVPTTFIWDMEQIEQVDVSSPEFKDLLVRLYQNLNLMQNVLNVKDSAFYDFTEFVNSQTFPSSLEGSSSTEKLNRRQVLRKVIDFGALPNSTTKSVAHGISITSGYTFTRLYGAASDPTNKRYIPIPNASTDINLLVDATNVNIKTSGSFSTYTTTYVILEYLNQ